MELEKGIHHAVLTPRRLWILFLGALTAAIIDATTTYWGWERGIQVEVSPWAKSLLESTPLSVYAYPIFFLVVATMPAAVRGPLLLFHLLQNVHGSVNNTVVLLTATPLLYPPNYFTLITFGFLLASLAMLLATHWKTKAGWRQSVLAWALYIFGFLPLYNVAISRHVAWGLLVTLVAGFSALQASRRFLARLP